MSILGQGLVKTGPDQYPFSRHLSESSADTLLATFLDNHTAHRLSLEYDYFSKFY